MSLQFLGARSPGEYNEENLKFDYNKSIENLKGSTILLVEDEEEIREAEKELFEIMGFKVIEAKNALEAINILKKLKNNIDYIFLDWKMPVMNGEETIYKLNEMNVKIPVFVVSGAFDDKIFDLKNKGLIKDIISKPFTKETILKKLFFA